MTLDIDKAAFNKKLQIIPDEPQEHSIPWLQNDKIKEFPRRLKRVEPFPGCCVKTWTEKGDKLFINVCHSKEICAPEDISDDKFREIIVEDVPSFVIPMAIGTEKMAKDKDEIERSTFDILVNTKYFEKCMKKSHFWQFTIVAILESIKDKYNKPINISKYVVLKNRKVMGSLDTFSIEDREPRKPEIKKPLIQELDSQENNLQNNNLQKKSKIEEKKKVSKQDSSNYREHEKFENYIIVKSADQKNLIGFFYLPSSSITDITIDIGESRIIVENQNQADSIIDLFVPQCIDNSNATANYDSKLHILRLTLPLKEN